LLHAQFGDNGNKVGFYDHRSLNTLIHGDIFQLLGFLKRYCKSKLLLTGNLPPGPTDDDHALFLGDMKSHLVKFLVDTNSIGPKSLVIEFLEFHQRPSMKKSICIVDMLGDQFLTFCKSENSKFAGMIFNPTQCSFGTPRCLHTVVPEKPGYGAFLSVFPLPKYSFDDSPCLLGVTLSGDGSVHIDPDESKCAPYITSITALFAAHKEMISLSSWFDEQPGIKFRAKCFSSFTVDTLEDLVQERNVKSFVYSLDALCFVNCYVEQYIKEGCHEGADYVPFTLEEDFFRRASKKIVQSVEWALIQEDMNMFRRGHVFMGGSCINPVANFHGLLSATSFSNLMDSKYLAYYTKVTLLLFPILFLCFICNSQLCTVHFVSTPGNSGWN